MTSQHRLQSLRFRWAARLCFGLLAVLMAASFAPAAQAAPRALYVSTTTGVMATFVINPDGSLSSRGAPSTGGSLTEGLAITPDAQHVYVANFSPASGSVAAFTVGPVGNLLSVSGSPFTTGFGNPLGVAPDPNGRWLFGWNHVSNNINVSAIGVDGSLTNITGSPFAEPAPHINPFGGSVAPDGNHVYVPDENNSPAGAPATVSAYSVASTGTTTSIQSIATGNPAVQTGPFASAITPDGKFLYVSNQDDGPNGTISGFAVNADGTLTTLTSGFPLDTTASGKHPSGMAISPDGAHLYVATQMTSTVNAYTINVDGSLTPVPGSPFGTGGTAGKALALTPDGKRLYVSNSGSNNISGFDVAADGSLTPISGSPWGTGITGTNPDLESIAITPNQPPTASFTASGGNAGLPSKFNGSGSTDADGSVVRYDWNFGDGTVLSNGGPTPDHTYARAGNYTATLTVTDNEGCSTARIFTGKATLCNGSPLAQIAQTLTVLAPVLSALRVSPPTFKLTGRRVKGRCVKQTAKNSSNRRCTRKPALLVSYTLSGATSVSFTLTRLTPGRKVNGRCVKPTAKNNKHKRCTRSNKVPGSITRNSNTGANHFTFTGTIGGNKLAPATYQLTATPANGASNTTKFTITR